MREGTLQGQGAVRRTKGGQYLLMREARDLDLREVMGEDAHDLTSTLK